VMNSRQYQWIARDEPAGDPDPLTYPESAKSASSEDSHSVSEAPAIELSPEVLGELLDPDGWSEVLSTYARTVGLAVALTDTEGRQSGICHNPQPAWLMAAGAKSEYRGACSFCLDPPEPCQAVTRALNSGQIELVRDQAGLVHVAVPLLFGQHRLGALIAGQVFDRYPEPLPLQRLAQKVGISPQQFWQRARLQPPFRTATLRVYAELLQSLGTAFLRQRYAEILDRSLATANLRLRLMVDGVAGHALFTLDETGLVTTWNNGAERIFGHAESDIVGKDFACLFTPEDIRAGEPGRLLRQADHDGSVNDHGWQVRKDGTRFFAEGSLAVLGKGGTREFGRLTHDVTDRRKAEEALQQAQKLESIGVLASGIAHDFNNLLAGILGGVSFAMTGLPPDHPARPALEIAEQASEKAADLTHQLLAYAGQGKFVVTRLDLSALIRDMLNLLRTFIPKRVELQLALEPDLPWIEADASQIRQIVMNLVINGAESMDPEGGSLRLSTGAVPAREPAVGRLGTEVFMEVRDSGSGMSEQTRARIFDPFFTTKFTGRGLGLAAVSGIVRGHDGTIQVESALGEGTTFRIYFPAVAKPVQVREKPAPPQNERGTGTILVVDDEPALRSLAKAILERNGYQVLLAKDGREAVETFRRNADTITAILLDITMPVMDGKEAFYLIRGIRADVPILVTTGYSESTTMELFEAGAVVEFVQKPYSAARLCERIRATLRAVPAVKGAGG
jgi:PAS domain S-box-containing protein